MVPTIFMAIGTGAKARPGKYPDELCERATRLAVEARKDPASRSGALSRIGGQLGINPETLRNWVNQAEIDDGCRPGTSTTDGEKIAQLETKIMGQTWGKTAPSLPSPDLPQPRHTGSVPAGARFIITGRPDPTLTAPPVGERVHARRSAGRARSAGS